MHRIGIAGPYIRFLILAERSIVVFGASKFHVQNFYMNIYYTNLKINKILPIPELLVVGKFLFVAPIVGIIN